MVGRMPNTATILERLRSEQGPLDELIELATEHVEGTPLTELIDPAAVAAALAASLDALADDTELEGKLRARATEAFDRLAEEDECPADRLPDELRTPLRQLATRPWPLDAELMRALMDHEAVRGLTRHVLQDALLEFGRTLRSFVPERAKPRKGRLSALVSAAQGVASAVTSEVERKLEHRVKAFVDGAIGGTLDKAVDYASRPRAAEDLAEWRGHALDVLAEWPWARWREQAEAVDDAGLWDHVATAIRELADWEGLADWAEERVRTSLEALGTTGDLIGEEPALRVWRDHTVETCRGAARGFVATEGFEAWLEALLAEA